MVFYFEPYNILLFYPLKRENLLIFYTIIYNGAVNSGAGICE